LIQRAQLIDEGRASQIRQIGVKLKRRKGSRQGSRASLWSLVKPHLQLTTVREVTNISVINRQTNNPLAA
jgi:hypothetical protein